MNYPNGNYHVEIFEDGTKIRENNLDFFEAQFPENIDLKITNYCDVNCAFCHEDSTIRGEHSILDAEFFRYSASIYGACHWGWQSSVSSRIDFVSY